MEAKSSTLRQSDFKRILELNQAALPAVSTLTLEALRHLCEQSIVLPIQRTGNRIDAFMIVLDQRASYQSENFLWFKSQYPQFAYVDRLVVDADRRSQGLGRALYAQAARTAHEQSLPLTCEVNIDPPNETSMAFHYRLGFESVGEQVTEGGKKRVKMLIHNNPTSLQSMA